MGKTLEVLTLVSDLPILLFLFYPRFNFGAVKTSNALRLIAHWAYNPASDFHVLIHCVHLLYDYK